MTSRRRFRVGWWLALVLLLVTGIWLRYRNVTEQILGGDENHAIRVAAQHSLGEIFTYHAPAENSMALSLYARVLMDSIGLNEFNYRIPAIISGLFVLLSPLLFRRQLGRAATLLAVSLLATSPCLIYYSFVGRPYSPAMALLILSILAWKSWLKRPSTGRLLAFLVSAALAVTLHVLLLLPVGLMVILSFVSNRRSGTPSLRNAVVMTALLLLAGLSIFGPGLPDFIEHRLQESASPSDPSFRLMWHAFEELTGGQKTMAWALLACMAAGAVRLLRRESLLGIVLVASLPAVLLTMWVTRIYPSGSAWVRYMSLAWPLFLMVTASGIVVVFHVVRRFVARRPLAALSAMIFGFAALVVRWDTPLSRETTIQSWLPWLPGLILLIASAEPLIVMLRRRPSVGRPRPAAGMALLGLLLAAGVMAWTPVPVLQQGVDSFRVRRESISSVPPRFSTEVPAFFESLAADEDGGEIVLVWPYHPEMFFWRSFVAEQKVHGKRVVAVQDPPNKIHEEGRVDFQNIISGHQLEELVEDGARYLVVHRDFWATDANSELERYGRYYESTFGPMLVAMHGPPVYADDNIEVHDLWGWYYRAVTEGQKLIGIERRDGMTVEFESGAVTGTVDVARVEEDSLRIAGWALDPEAHQPADIVLLLTAQGFVYPVATGVQRAGVAKSHGVNNAGFSVLIPLDRFPDKALHELTAVGIVGSRAWFLGTRKN